MRCYFCLEELVVNTVFYPDEHKSLNHYYVHISNDPALIYSEYPLRNGKYKISHSCQLGSIRIDKVSKNWAFPVAVVQLELDSEKDILEKFYRTSYGAIRELSTYGDSLRLKK